MLKTRNILIFLACISAILAGMASADYAPRDHVDFELYDQRLPGQLVLVGDEGRIVWYNQASDTEWYWFSIASSPSMVTDVNYLFPIDQGDPNSVLFTPGGSSPVPLVWATVDSTLIDINSSDPNIVTIALPTKEPWSVMFADVNGYPLTEDNNNITFYDPCNFFGVGLGGIADDTLANNFIQVYKLLNFDPTLLNVSVGWARTDVLTGPNNVRVGEGAGGILETARRNALGGKDAGQFVVDSNDNAAWGYQALGGGGDGTAAHYPLLRTTSAQSDPGLTQTTAISNYTELQAINDDAVGGFIDGDYYLTNDIDASASQAGNGFEGLEIFRGDFDGQGFTISGLFMNRGNSAYGLFDHVRGGARIANVTVDVNFINGGRCGGLIGELQCTTSDILIQNCHTTGTIANNNASTDSDYGGLIGRALGTVNWRAKIFDCSSSVDIDVSVATLSLENGGFAGVSAFADISNCFATGDITRNDQECRQIGGFIGIISTGSKVEYCYATGDVEGTSIVGGFAGEIKNEGDWGDQYVRKCYSTGNATLAVAGAVGSGGGFVGLINEDDTEITDCYAWGNVVSTTGDNMGGFAGGVASPHDPNVSQVYSIGVPTGDDNLGGLVGANGIGATPVFSDTYWDTQTSGLTTSAEGTGHTTAWLQTRANYPATWDFDTIWILEGGNVLAASAFGSGALANLETGGDYTVGLGFGAGFNAVTTFRSVYLGPYAGYNQTTLDNRLIVDSRDRTSAADEQLKAILYGFMADDANDQWLNINADVNTFSLSTSYITDVNYIDFTTGIAAPSWLEGRIFYDDDEKTLAVYNNESDISLQLGQELFLRATNKTGSTITKGQLVYVDGAQGSRPTIDLAKSDLPGTCGVIAIATHDILDNATGFCTTYGYVHDVNTAGFSAGDELYLSDSVAGTYVNVAPTAPSFVIEIGKVLFANASSGIICANIGPIDVCRTMVIQDLDINTNLDVNDVMSLSPNLAVFQSNTDSTTFLQVLDADGGTPILNVDSTNERVGIGQASPTGALHISSGDIILDGSATYGIDLSGGTWSTGVLNFDQPFDIFSNGTRAMYFNDADSIAVFGMGDAGNIDSITSANNITVIGSKGLRNLTSGSNIVAIATLAGGGVTSASGCIFIGPSTGGAITTGQNDTAIGLLALNNVPSGCLRATGIGPSAGRYSSNDSTSVGNEAGKGSSGGGYARTTNLGSFAGSGNRFSDDSIFIGYKGGINQIDVDDLLIIDNQDRGSIAAEITDCLFYGVMNSTVASQTMRINAGTFSFGAGVDNDLTVNFIGTDSTGVLTWMEDEDRFDFADHIALKANKEVRFYDNGNYVGFEAPALSADQIWVLPTADGADGDVMFTDGSGNLKWGANASTRSFIFSSPSGGSGTIYAGGHYRFSATDNDFNPSITFGTANGAYGDHVFIVAAAGGSGGTDTVIRVTGTSITDAAVRTAADTEDLTADDAGAAGAYYETAKKWIGQVTIAKQSGPDLLCNYGGAKYWDDNNEAFKVTGVDVTWLGGANDANPNLILRHHKATGWTYNAGSTPTPPIAIASMNTDYVTEIEVINGEEGAWKRTNLSVNVDGSGSEGTIVEIVTTANKAFEIGNFLMRIVPQ